MPRLLSRNVLLAMSICSSVVSGCSQNSESPVVLTPSLSDPLEQNLATNESDREASEFADIDTLSEEQRLLDRLETGSLRALSALNEIYYQGKLDDDHLACVDSTGAYPLTDYFCGDDQSGALMSKFGFPVSALRVNANALCTEQLISPKSLDGCDIESMEVIFEEYWHVRYRKSYVGALQRTQLLISEGSIPFFVDPAFAPNTCELMMVQGEPTLQNDVDFCPLAVSTVLGLTPSPAEN